MGSPLGEASSLRTDWKLKEESFLVSSLSPIPQSLALVHSPRQLEVFPTTWARQVLSQIKNPNGYPSHHGYAGSTRRCFQISRSGTRLSVCLITPCHAFCEPFISPHPVSCLAVRPVNRKATVFASLRVHPILSSCQSIPSLSGSPSPD